MPKGRARGASELNATTVTPASSGPPIYKYLSFLSTVSFDSLQRVRNIPGRSAHVRKRANHAACVKGCTRQDGRTQEEEWAYGCSLTSIECLHYDSLKCYKAGLINVPAKRRAFESSAPEECRRSPSWIRCYPRD